MQIYLQFHIEVWLTLKWYIPRLMYHNLCEDYDPDLVEMERYFIQLSEREGSFVVEILIL